MDLQLKDKSAFVTGSTAGIGLAIATSLAREGATVWINGRSQGRVDDAMAAIKRDVPGATVQGIVADLATAEGCAAAIRALPGVDILVNNLGIFAEVPFEK
ncbi:MAG: SDR family NAD(P)-dependent oxidoreductase, partial [Tepidisphaeraceae bacterium]